MERESNGGTFHAKTQRNRKAQSPEQRHFHLPNNRVVHCVPCAPVAQRLEQQTHNLLVRGSNPCGGTK